MRTTLLFLLASVLSSAATITSGTLVTIIGDYAYRGWQLQISAPGFQLWNGLRQWHQPFGVPLCTGPCTYDFSGQLSSGMFPSLVLNGVNYSFSTGYIVSFTMNFVGTPQTVTAVASPPPPGRSGPIVWETVWPSNPFSMSGVITVIRQTSPFGVPVLTENISGQGFTTAYSWVSQEAGPWNYSGTTFAFIPEPSAFLLAASGVALLALAKLRRL